MAKVFLCFVFLAFLHNCSEGFRINQKDLRLALDLARDLESLEKRQDIPVDIGSEDTNTRGDASATDTAPADPSETGTPVVDTSGIEIPTGDISGTYNALPDSSGSEIPAGDTSGTEISAGDISGTDNAPSETSGTETSAADTPTVNTSATNGTGAEDVAGASASETPADEVTEAEETGAVPSTVDAENTITEDSSFQQASEDLKQKIRDGRKALSTLLTSLRGHTEDLLKKIQDTLDSTEDTMRNLLNEAADVTDDKLINQLTMARKMAVLEATRKKAEEATRKNAIKAAKKAAARKKAAEAVMKAAMKAAEEQEENKGKTNKAKQSNKWHKGRHHENLFGLQNHAAMNKVASDFLKKFSAFVKSREHN